MRGFYHSKQVDWSAPITRHAIYNLSLCAFAGNQLTSLRGAFRSLASVEKLTAAKNNISTVDASFLGGLGRLTHLDLSGNRLHTFHVTDGE